LFGLSGFSRRINRLCTFRAQFCFLLILLLITIVLCLILKNYIDSDYQLFHWHTPFTVPLKPHLLCVLVPFRNREEELKIFIPHMEHFLNRQNVSHRIIILNQTDMYRFNRASLINVGWFEADRVGCDYLVMHDVDLLPLNPELDYRFPGYGNVRHISAPEYHPRYNYKKFIGGILMLTLKDFKMVNGLSNKYWGWGLEDDEFFLRLRDGNLTDNLQRPKGLKTNKENTFRHVHDAKKRVRDTKKTVQQKAVRFCNSMVTFTLATRYKVMKWMSRKRDTVSGLDNVRYEIVSRAIQKFSDDAQYYILNIKLFCDLNWTPYCVQTS
uniref:Beta-1,4-N-acetylgalactosaminyltransferase n=1 Tax=Syphacia muris TaxID=451379 RepID=A0A0N5AFT4_9BILA